MSLVLYTPGHGLITDSLILHGIIRILAVAGVYNAKVERLGDRFLVKIDNNVNLNDVTSIFKNSELAQLLKSSAKLKFDVKLETPPLNKIFSLNIDKAHNNKWAENVYEILDGTRTSGLDLSSLTYYDHKSQLREGRGGKNKTLYLPMSSIYGKYTVKDYGAKFSQYKVCDTCFLLASLGLLYGAYALVARQGRDKRPLLMTIVPRDRMEARDLLVLQRLLEGYEEVNIKDIPILATPVYALSAGETLISLDSPAEVVTWKLSLTGNSQRSSQRSLDVVTLQFNTIVEFIARLKHEVPEWPRLVECLRTEDGYVILSDLTIALNYDRTPLRAYEVIREILSYAVKEARKGRRVCEELLHRHYKIANILV
ncbi:CRISPR-associated protein, MJ0385 [Desulfurococcus amylolyticus]|uniref:CRISPR-associated protein, MJ0385 n=1 Tax=Desulfurococcus amylolyticus DSM 16532 TaxID=768672 RepID=I3XQX0_DESAM|nr:CRISPR-associated protein, MJ0385 [Desulfurococcus amylolyticus]AFL66344.1 CRISPR-associated protein, MJ0385 [Desulfurococcus amylolyticus DSM 16532]